MAAVAAASPADELSVLGTTAGISELGMGLGPVAGMSVAMGLGAASFVGVRRLHRWINDGKSSS